MCKSSMTDDLEIFLMDLTKSRTIDSMYSLFEFLWCYIYERRDNCNVEQLLEIFIKIKEKNNWSTIGRNYMRNIRRPDSYISEFVQLVVDCEEIVSDDKNVVTSTICEYYGSEFVREVFCKDNEFEFQLSGTKHADKTFSLKISSIKGDDPDTFNMQLKLPDPLIRIHVMIEWFHRDSGKWRILPITWCGKPVCDETKCFWNWGYLKFHRNDSALNSMLDSNSRVGCAQWISYLTVYDEAPCRLIAFEVE